MNTVITINMNNAALCRLEQQARAGHDAATARTQPGQSPVDVAGNRTNVARRPQGLAGPSAPRRATARPATV